MRWCVMAVLASGVSYRQLSGKSTVPLQPRVITLHTMAGTLAGTEAWFSGTGRAYSHFGVGGGGEIRQWQDLRYRAASDLYGNPYSISIETEDRGPAFPAWSGSDVPAWTPAQVDALVVLLAWLCARFGLPTSAIRSSCTHERGVGWHRVGIDPWRDPSCPRWSSTRGKVCPGDRRIAQIHNQVLPRLGAGSAPVQEDDMFSDDDRELLREAVIALRASNQPKSGHYGGRVLREIRDKQVPAAQKAVDEVMHLYAEAGDSALHKVVRQAAGVDTGEVAEAAGDAAREAVAAALPVALAGLTPDTIAEAVLDGLGEEHARAVVDELAGRLTGT